MIKLKELISEVKVGSARVGLGGRGKEIELIVDRATGVGGKPFILI